MWHSVKLQEYLALSQDGMIRGRKGGKVFSGTAMSWGLAYALKEKAYYNLRDPTPLLEHIVCSNVSLHGQQNNLFDLNFRHITPSSWCSFRLGTMRLTAPLRRLTTLHKQVLNQSSPVQQTQEWALTAMHHGYRQAQLGWQLTCQPHLVSSSQQWLCFVRMAHHKGILHHFRSRTTRA